MRRIPRIFAICIFVFSFICFSTFANAQAQMNYHYLELIDSKKNPIPDAKVEVRTNRDRSETLQTDANGKGRIGVLYPSGLGSYASIFTITKPGYYPFYDFGLVFDRFDYYNFQLELLKIPKTKKERKALGNEQLKREFITAVRIGDTEAVGKLLKSGISPNLTTGDLKGIFLERGVVDIPAIAFPIILGHGAVVKLLLEKGAVLPKPLNNDGSPQSKQNNFNVLVNYLNADFDSRTYSVSDEKEREKLIQKTEQERNEGLKALIKAGANVNISGYNVSKYRESTPLIISLDKRYVSAAGILIESGAKINAQDESGNTALMSAVNEGLVDGVKLLIEKGADVNAKNHGEATALSIAKYKSSASYRDLYKEIIKLLEAAGAK